MGRGRGEAALWAAPGPSRLGPRPSQTPAYTLPSVFRWTPSTWVPHPCPVSWRTSPNTSARTPAAGAAAAVAVRRDGVDVTTRGRRDHGEEAVGVRGPAPRKPRGKEGPGGVDAFPRSCARARAAWRAGTVWAGIPAAAPARRPNQKRKEPVPPPPSPAPRPAVPQPRRRVRGEVAARLQVGGAAAL